MSIRGSSRVSFTVSSSELKTKVLTWLLLGLVAWQGLWMARKILYEVADVPRRGLAHAFSDSEDQRIRKSMQVYDDIAGESLGLYELQRAIVRNSEEGARVFCVPGEDDYILRALIGLSGFLYPRRIDIVSRLPGDEERGHRPDLLVLTLRGPHLDSPRGYKQPIASSAAWTLWK